jgi:hypothetical protein
VVCGVWRLERLVGVKMGRRGTDRHVYDWPETARVCCHNLGCEQACTCKPLSMVEPVVLRWIVVGLRLCCTSQVWGGGGLQLRTLHMLLVHLMPLAACMIRILGPGLFWL